MLKTLSDTKPAKRTERVTATVTAIKDTPVAGKNGGRLWEIKLSSPDNLNGIKTYHSEKSGMDYYSVGMWGENESPEGTDFIAGRRYEMDVEVSADNKYFTVKAARLADGIVSGHPMLSGKHPVAKHPEVSEEAEEPLPPLEPFEPEVEAAAPVPGVNLRGDGSGENTSTLERNAMDALRALMFHYLRNKSYL